MQNHDRCLLISENRPEWMISDLAIMLAKGITVPAYTTYTERDYDYLIDDCCPSVVIVSDETQYNKIKNIIIKKPFIKKVISFEKIKNEIIFLIKGFFFIIFFILLYWVLSEIIITDGLQSSIKYS